MNNQILAPMPGKILSVKVKEGDRVESDQVVLVLEAMKMENEVYSECSGIIEQVRVKTGDIVQPGDVLVTIR